MSEIADAVKTTSYRTLVSNGIINPAPKCVCGVALRLLSFPVTAHPMIHALEFSNYIRTKITKHSDTSWTITYWTGRYVGYSWKQLDNFWDSTAPQNTNLFCQQSCIVARKVMQGLHDAMQKFKSSEEITTVLRPVTGMIALPENVLKYDLKLPAKRAQFAPFMLDYLRFTKKSILQTADKYQASLRSRLEKESELDTTYFKQLLRAAAEGPAETESNDKLYDRVVNKRDISNLSNRNYRMVTSIFSVLSSYFPSEYSLPPYTWAIADAAINNEQYYPEGVFVNKNV